MALAITTGYRQAGVFVLFRHMLLSRFLQCFCFRFSFRLQWVMTPSGSSETTTRENHPSRSFVLRCLISSVGPPYADEDVYPPAHLERISRFGPQRTCSMCGDADFRPVALTQQVEVGAHSAQIWQYIKRWLCFWKIKVQPTVKPGLNKDILNTYCLYSIRVLYSPKGSNAENYITWK